MADFKVSLRPGKYQSTLGALRDFLLLKRTGYLDIELELPTEETPVNLQQRCSNLYIIGFKGAKDKATDKWYHFDGEEGGWGESCGVGSNYNNLADVPMMSTDMVDGLSSLAEFKPGMKIDTKLVVVAAAVIAESLRFATVTTYFTGLFNGCYGKFDLNQVVPTDKLKDKYFVNWNKLSGKNDPDVLVKK
jgi:hypothetical protein